MAWQVGQRVGGVVQDAPRPPSGLRFATRSRQHRPSPIAGPLRSQLRRVRRVRPHQALERVHAELLSRIDRLPADHIQSLSAYVGQSAASKPCSWPGW